MTSDNSNDAAIELSVVVPCYNEKNAIRDTVSLLSEHLAPLGDSFEGMLQLLALRSKAVSLNSCPEVMNRNDTVE